MAEVEAINDLTLRKLQERIKVSIEALHQWKNRRTQDVSSSAPTNEQKTKSVNNQQEEKLPKFQLLLDHMAQTNNETQDKLRALSIKVDQCIQASGRITNTEPCSPAKDVTEVKATIAAIRADVDNFKATVKKEKHDRAGSNKKINFGILRLLETLILVSTDQFHKMNQKKTKKVHLQLEEKPPENHHLWDHMVQTTNNTQDKLESLSKKVDNFIRASEHRKESKIESVNSQEEEKLSEFHRLWNQMAHTKNDTQDRFMALTKKVDHCIQASESIENAVQRMRDPDPLRYKMVS